MSFSVVELTFMVSVKLTVRALLVENSCSRNNTVVKAFGSNIEH